MHFYSVRNLLLSVWIIPTRLFLSWWHTVQKPWYTLPANDTNRKKQLLNYTIYVSFCSKFVHDRSLMTHYTEIHIFLYCPISWKMLSSLHFIFHLCLQTNEQCYRLLGLTNHSLAFHPVSGMKLNMFNPMPVSGTRKIWYQKSMTHWPVSGTRNWPVCHHY